MDCSTVTFTCISFYDEQVGLEVEYLKDIEECEIEEMGMWDSTEIMQSEKEAFEQGKLKIYEPQKNKKKWNSEIMEFLLVSFVNGLHLPM